MRKARSLVLSAGLMGCVWSFMFHNAPRYSGRDMRGVIELTLGFFVPGHAATR